MPALLDLGGGQILLILFLLLMAAVPIALVGGAVFLAVRQAEKKRAATANPKQQTVTRQVEEDDDMTPIHNEAAKRRRAEHQLAIFMLACLAISAAAGFIAYWIEDYSPDTFVGFGLLLGIGVGTAIWGRRAGCFRRGAETPMRPRYRQLAMVLGILMLVCGGALFVIAASEGRRTMLFDALNALCVGVLFIYLSRKAAAVAAQHSVVPEHGSPPPNLENGSGTHQ